MPRIVLQPATYPGLQSGIRQLVAAIRPTLGPLARVVAIDHVAGNKAPELLDDGGLIARRIFQLPDRDEDVGAMLLRHVLWQQYELIGDGVATTAVLFQTVFDQGLRYITAGGNAMQLRRYLEQGLRLIDRELAGMVLTFEGQSHLTQIAESICHDPDLAQVLGEVFDILGEFGTLEIQAGRGRDVDYEYTEGWYWAGGAHSRTLLQGCPQESARLDRAAVLVSDLTITDPRAVAPLVAQAMKAELPALLIIASEISDEAMSVLMAANKRSEGKFRVMAVKPPGTNIHARAEALADLALVTGGKLFADAAGDDIRTATLPDLGYVRTAWVTRHLGGIIGGQGDPRAIRTYVAQLRHAYQREKLPDKRKKLRERIGKFMGGSITLRVGGMTESEIAARRAMAERTAEVLRGVVHDGVLPGGGIALLACRPALKDQMAQASDPDERAAYHILLTALDAPLRAILTNAGIDISSALHQIEQTPPGYGIDARSAEVVKMSEAGIYDSARVQREALRHAVSNAALALTVDVIVHRAGYEQDATPTSA